MQKKRGIDGEKAAFFWLRKNNFNVVLKNYHSRFGEIDLIAIKKSFIFFIEVKFRNFNCFYKPKEAVDLLKQRKIIKTAMVFLNRHKTRLQPIFSVCEVVRQKNGLFRINFLNNAFDVKNEFEIFKNI